MAVDITISTNHTTIHGSTSNIMDGDTSTYWRSGTLQTAGMHLQFEFSKVVILNGLTIQTITETRYVVKSGSTLQTSFDGSTWTTIGTFDGSTTPTFSNLSVKCKYVRIRASTGTARALSINEVTFDYEEIPTIAIRVRRSNDWVKTTAAYKKQNGTWTLIDPTAAFSTDTGIIRGN